jgi:hypothetical protein
MNDFFNLLIAVGAFALFCGLIAVNNLNNKDFSDYERKICRDYSIYCAILSIICFTAVFYAPQINSFFLVKPHFSHPVKTAPVALKLKKALVNR